MNDTIFPAHAARARARRASERDGSPAAARVAARGSQRRRVEVHGCAALLFFHFDARGSAWDRYADAILAAWR